MKKLLLDIVALCMFVCTISADSVIYLGGQSNYLRFKFNNPNQLKGYQAGIYGGYTYCRKKFYSDINGEGYWNTGPVTGRPCQRSSVQEYFAKLKLGISFPFRCSTMNCTAYSGVGYNHFHNKQDPAAMGLSYKYTKAFIPIGIFIDRCFNETVSLALQAEFRPDIYSHLKVVMEKLELKKEYGARVQLPLIFYLGWRKCASVSVVPFFDWNRFGRTTECTSTGVMLPVPQLSRWQLGSRLIFSYAF